ncbi:MAG: hypothetical protein HYR68_07425, partial [Burkholderiales bacterium]|nr:hypothetical protein [Burkholderiales bacterium]
GGALGILLLSWFILLVPSVALQYTPACAALVPQMKRHMQFALAIPILLMPVAFSLILGMHMQGKFFQGWFFGVLSLLIYIASVRSTWVIILVVLMAQVPMWLNNRVSMSVQADWNQPLLFVIAGFALTALVLHWVFALRGDQHFKRDESFAMLKKHIQGEEVSVNHFTLKFLNPYHLLLRLCINRVKATPEKVRQLMPFAMGSQILWLTSFIPVVVMSAGLGIYFIFFLRGSLRSEGIDNSVAYFAALVSFIMLPPIYAAFVRTCVYQRKEEQGLLLLAPKLPSLHQHSKMMLQFILRQYLSLWLVSVLITVGAAYLSPASEYMHEMAWIISFSLLPVSVLSLTNYAQIKSSYQTALLVALVIPVLLGAAMLGVHKMMPALPVWLICSLIAVGTAAVLGWRWQGLMQVKAVFPAGRAV